MCGRFVEINHAKQQINTFSGNLFIPLTNLSQSLDYNNLQEVFRQIRSPRYPPVPQTASKIARMAPTAITSLMAKTAVMDLWEASIRFMALYALSYENRATA